MESMRQLDKILYLGSTMAENSDLPKLYFM